MNETFLRIMELDYMGFYCSQILLIMALEAQGKKDPDLIRAMGGLAHGSGFEGGTCGALTGAACLLGLYAAKGSEDEYEDENLSHMLNDLGNWFTQTFSGNDGDISCESIIGDRTEFRQRCGAIITQTYFKVLQILNAAGYEISTGR